MAVDYLVSPARLYSKAMEINGYSFLSEIPNFRKIDMAVEIAETWAGDWDEGQGFGSSDFTYMVQDYLDNLIEYVGGLKTEFNPYLSIVKTEA